MRRSCLWGFAALLLATTGWTASPRALRVQTILLSVGELDRSVDFYTRVLDFKKQRETEVSGESSERLFGVFGARVRFAELTLGDESLTLAQFLAPEGRPIAVDARSNDQNFQHIAIIVRDMDAAYAHLRKSHIRFASSGPQRLPDWNRNAAGIQAFYFKDPDGHPVEILAFPKDKGAAKWKRPSSALFLGIDHSAIVVRNTEVSLRFYRDTLGMKVVGESENYGTEQEHLNNIFGAHLRITTLHAADGPGVEFLEYLAPTDGRPFGDAHPNDLISTETWIRVDSWKSDVPGQRVSAGWTPNSLAQDHPSVLVHDPDGHAVMLLQN